jgi:hypothetical protein
MVEKVINDTGELINLGDVGKHEDDPASLCGSKHEVAIGTTVNTQGLTPFNDYIIVYFRPYDTSGGGILMEWLGKAVNYAMKVGAGGIKIFTDPQDWYGTVTTGFGESMAQSSRDRGVVYGEGAEGGFAKGYKETIDYIFSWGSETDLSYKNAESPFYTPYQAEPKQFAVEDASTSCGDSMLDTWAEYTGGCYHGLAGNYHKVRITIKCTYEGVTTTKYRSDLAGCPAQYEEDSWCENGEVYKRFLFNSPGTWTVEVKPISANICVNLDYTETATFEVAKPEGWEPSAITTMSTNISTQFQEAGIPVAITPLHIVGIGSLVGGLLLFKIYKKKKAKAE